jgi:transposase
LLVLVGGGGKKFPRIEREQILNVYRASPEVVISLLEHLQDGVLAIIEEHEARIEELEEKLNRDSHSSNKPASGDEPKRRLAPRHPECGDKKPGGRQGQEGTTLRMVHHPTHVEVHEARRCQGCGRSLKEVKPRGCVARQVFEIPRITAEVTEHRAHVKCCPHCRELSVAVFPRWVKHPTHCVRFEGFRPKLFLTNREMAQIPGLVLQSMAPLWPWLFG